MRSVRFSALALAFLLLAAGCSSTSETRRDDPEPPPTETAEPPRAERPPEPEPQPRAETPPAPRQPVTRTVQGFRVQVLTSDDKGEAEAALAEATTWWSGLADRPLGLDTPDAPVEIAWQQPYYRVRVGTFASRAEAERALPLLKRRFGKAFIVPDRVTITR